MPVLRWSPTIEAGHILQALTIGGGIAAAGLTAYLTVVNLDSATKIEIALIEQRLKQDEDQAGQMRTEHKALVDAVSQGLDKLSAQVVDLKVLIAERKGGRDAGR